jgi:hypothetical protein
MCLDMHELKLKLPLSLSIILRMYKGSGGMTPGMELNGQLHTQVALLPMQTLITHENRKTVNLTLCPSTAP